jgi:hypothetical protein
LSSNDWIQIRTQIHKNAWIHIRIQIHKKARIQIRIKKICIQKCAQKSIERPQHFSRSCYRNLRHNDCSKPFPFTVVQCFVGWAPCVLRVPLRHVRYRFHNGMYLQQCPCSDTRKPLRCSKIVSVLRIWDPGSCAFLTPGSRMGKKSRSNPGYGSGINIQITIPREFFG